MTTKDLLMTQITKIAMYAFFLLLNILGFILAWVWFGWKAALVVFLVSIKASGKSN